LLTPPTAPGSPALFSEIIFPPAGTVVVAVSGGSDSTALLLLLQDHLQRSSSGLLLLSVTVDHGLRTESAREAEQVERICAGRGIPHRTMRWNAEKPSAGVAASAREARYGLLAEAARYVGASMIFTGHTLDDQAETVFMRRQRGDGRGLAGMAPATLYDGEAWIMRPLLGVSRTDLRDVLRSENQAWVEDPSNVDPDFERVRARQAIAQEGGEGLARLIEECREAARRREIENAEAARLIEESCRLEAPGLVRVSGGLTSADPSAGILALRILLAAVSGRDHLADEGRTMALWSRLSEGPFRATLAGAMLDVRKAGLFLYREMRSGWTGATPAKAGALWDGRYRVVAQRLPPGTVVEAAGKTLAAARARPWTHAAARPSLVQAALAAEPVLRLRGAVGQDEVAPPSEGEALQRVPAPWARFLPSFDLPTAHAIAGLFGCEAIPSPPLRRGSAQSNKDPAH
jgi:tRNA(Ile)-lysidine synthase